MIEMGPNTLEKKKKRQQESYGAQHRGEGEKKAMVHSPEGVGEKH